MLLKSQNYAQICPYCRRALTTLTSALFWSTEESAERSVVLCFGAVYFLLTMGFIMTADRMFDVGFDAGWLILLRRVDS